MKHIAFSLGALLALPFVHGQDLMKPVVVIGEEEFGSSSLVDVEALEAEQITELLGYVPGFASVASDSSGYGDIVAVRGSANTLFFGGGGVAMMVDDVPYGDVFSYSTDFFDLESFALHRGPQGTRFSRNGVGGLIEMRTPGPAKEIEHEFSAEYGSYNLTHLRFRSSGPFPDDSKWHYAFQAYYKERDGFLDNVNPAVGGSNDTREHLGLLGKLYYRPSADFEVILRAMYERTRDGSQRLTALPGVASDFGPGIDALRAQDPFEVSSNLAGRTEVDRLQFSLHVAQDFEWAKFRSITSFSDWKLGPNTVDLDLSPVSASRSSITQDHEVRSQEFRFDSPEDARLRWTAGLAYLQKENDGTANRFFQSDLGGRLPFVADFNQFTNFAVEEESAALFGNVSWDASEALTFRVGGRLEYVENSLARTKIDQSAILPPFMPIRSESDGWFFSPSLGLNYALNSRLSAFARTSLAFKPQGFTGFSDNPATAEFDEEQSWETELGMRYENEDGSLGAEVRGYYKRIDDYQLNRSAAITDFLVVNAERVDALGLEAELFWNPVKNLTLQATAGWNQIEFEDHTGPGGQDLSGNEVPFLPDFTAGLLARYDFPKGFFVKTGVRAVGATFYEETNNRDFRQGSYEVWDASIGYENETWNAEVFARNLFDEDYYAFMNNQIAAGVPGAPQIFGVRAGLKF